MAVLRRVHGGERTLVCKQMDLDFNGTRDYTAVLDVAGKMVFEKPTDDY